MVIVSSQMLTQTTEITGESSPTITAKLTKLNKTKNSYGGLNYNRQKHLYFSRSYYDLIPLLCAKQKWDKYVLG